MMKVLPKNAREPAPEPGVERLAAPLAKVVTDTGTARRDGRVPGALGGLARGDAPEGPPSTERSPPTTMRAVVQDRYGDTDVLRMRTIDVPRPGDAQVLIEVHAAGVDRGVWHLMTGLPYLVRFVGFGLIRPKQPVPGMDVSGRVVAVGASVTDFRVGDEVLGIGSGTFAEYAVADPCKLARRPSSVTATEAAAVPISGVTALQALRDVGHIRAGQRVLVVGASGGVGVYAVQLARHFGARVDGLAGSAKLDLVRSLGAERVFDHARENALDGSVRYDLILDIGGRNSLAALRRALAPNGTLVIVGGEGGERFTGGMGRSLRAVALSPFVSQRLAMFVSAERGDDVAWLSGLLAGGELVAPVDRTYRLDEAPAAIADLVAGRVRGKAVVRVATP